jgi:spermidine synthase
MLPWITLDVARIPGGGEIKLKRRGTEFSIMLGANELMNSRLSSSEEALAGIAAKALGGRAASRVLIGGLGMGFTLRAALSAFPPDASITVSELVPAVIAWARGPMSELFAGMLDEPRVTVLEADVGAALSSAKASFDAVLLDVDNGPDGLTTSANDRLYGRSGLAAARAALRQGGVLAVWSAAPDAAFGRRFGQAGFKVSESLVRAHRGKGAKHVIWTGVKG